MTESKGPTSSPRLAARRLSPFAATVRHVPNLVPPIVHEVLRSSGQQLDVGTRAFMEPRFGHDFSNVRVHTDAQAARSARAVNAFAYTVANHIVLGNGHSSPETTSTKRLLAHELAHVVQQRNSKVFQGFGISSPGDPQEQQAARAEEAIMSGRSAPPLSEATHVVQRQKGDPLDPFGEEEKEKKKPKLDPTSGKVYAACPSLCQTFPPVQVAPGAFVALCDDSVLMNGPNVSTVGCTPNRQGKVGLFAGSPAWQLPPPKVEMCNFGTCELHGASTNGIQIGYIQTVEKAWLGGVYFKKKKKSQKWRWAGNKWWCVNNSRDGLETSTAPWYGDSKQFGPQPFGGACPALTDTPHVVLRARQKTKKVGGVERGGNPLRRMRIDGIFHTWLVAKPPKGSLVFIHHWSFQCWVVAELGANDADPCHERQWVKMNMNKLTTSGPGKGSATPVLTGDVASKTKTDCSAP